MTTEKQIPTFQEVAEQLKNKPEILVLGKVWYAAALLELIDEINAKLVPTGESEWRLPTVRELLIDSSKENKKFGEWFTWSGEKLNTHLWIVNMSTGVYFYDTSGSQVEAYLVKS